MKTNRFISLYLIACVALLVFWACRKEKSQGVSNIASNEALLAASKEFIQSKVSSTSFENLDFSNAIIYRLKGATAAVRVPLKNLPKATDYIMLGSVDGKKWSGNYVKVLNSEPPSTFRDISFKLTSFDSTEVKIKGQMGQSRTSSMEAPPVINTGVPGIIWLNFISQFHLTDPIYENWYYLGGGGGSSPPPLGSSNTLYYDPYDGGNVTTSRKLRDSFPCAVKILDTISSELNLNKQAQLALNEIFNIGKKIHLNFDISLTMTKDSVDAYTKVNSAYTTLLPDSTEGLDFYATITLNPWVLKHATKEYIAATMLHEGIHAYINFKWHQYIHNIIDSNAFKTLFPLYWPPRQMASGTYVNPSTIVHHNVMAANLITYLAEPLYALHNSNMTFVMKDSLYKALSWGGLGETTVWRTKTDTCNIIAINDVARDTSLGAGHTFGPFVVNGCPGSYSFSYDSLKFKMPCQ
jgi:hypothetical protein